LIALPELILYKYLHCKAICDDIIHRYKYVTVIMKIRISFLNSKTMRTKITMPKIMWHIVEHMTWNDRPELLQEICNNTVDFN